MLHLCSCMKADNGITSENEIHEVCSSGANAEGIQDSTWAEENKPEPQKEQHTCSQKTYAQRCSICNRTEAGINCELKGFMTTYQRNCTSSDSVMLVKNIDKGTDRLHCKSHRSHEEDGRNKKAHESPSDGCCSSSSEESERPNYTAETFKQKIRNKVKDGGRSRKCQKSPPHLSDVDGTIQESNVSKASFQEHGYFNEAKLFWTKVRATGSVDHLFEELSDVLNCLKQKITDGTANDQDYLKALILVRKAGIHDSPLSFDKSENEEQLQHDSEEEISEKVMISEEMEAQSTPSSSLFMQTSVIKSVPSSAASLPSTDGFIQPNTPNQLTFQQHQCSSLCIARVTPPAPDHFKGENPLRIPILCQFQRRHGKLHWDTEVVDPPHVTYKAPCGRGLRNFKEVRDYIFETQCDFLTLDFFSFNTYVQLSRTISCKNPVIYENDISHGIEPVPIPLYNAIDVSKPRYFKYRKTRLPHGYLISSSAEMFQHKCNCTDGCNDKSRCACQQQTANVNKRFKGATGYEYKRLLQNAPSGLYECNRWCKCNERLCENRVVQHGLKTRLQLFKAKKKGWGVRCRDDIDKGTFVCCYAGRVLNIVNAVENQRNDEMINYDIDVGRSNIVKPSSKAEKNGSHLESDGELMDAMEDRKTDMKIEEATPFHRTSALSQKGREKPECEKSCFHSSEKSTNKRPKTKTALLQAQRRRLLEQGQISITYSSSEEDNSELSGQRSKKVPRTLEPFSLKRHTTLSDNRLINSDKGDSDNRSCVAYGINYSVSLGENPASKTSDEWENETNNQKANVQDKLIQNNHHKEQASELQRICNVNEQGNSCYFLDATKEGNVGRFINHSCDPNLMVQSVFVDTHDKNLPWVAFFTNRYIKAGSELTWDYRYSTGSMPEEEIPCLCGSVNCRESIV
ncbi:histone-lysine N-methyltransferase SETDB2 isoform X1 [Stegostoma tigrinum]|uniref:histone-lysine N-methyltransferase SETDB2 isoform X1 n=2 Tax=Stegostoma tigrinum TaxID=3053191 RepID=UPI00202B108C|nr:histone-lysine N-methyltransferase SETDB2 isoform X1 [Stegostoma tigrinum]XP_048396511.1 histone-lysine N-methyltransferase SETDB2 isoform X1 [Stegostoma tigrinum]XP_048396512.1 histone-lysine N-methyltransferase SETDB2 isoform X1 [Stegostoma tigrinum]XP_048396513.1 histone-lysine N-methyltransferase SETDB2 isoform X1 [Stegostoma tigrinum]